MRTGGQETLSRPKNACVEAPRDPFWQAARAHLSPNRPLAPGDAYEADVEPLVEVTRGHPPRVAASLLACAETRSLRATTAGSGGSLPVPGAPGRDE